MKTANWLLSLTLLIAAPGIAIAAPASRTPQASIAFANHGGIQSWRADGDSAVYLEDRQRHWYRATLIGRAIDLPFAEAIGIDAGPNGTLDQFGAIVVKSQRYPFSTFEQVDGPPAKAHATPK